MVVTLYSWRHKDPCTGRRRVLRFKLSDDQAREWTEKESVELEKLPNSDEHRKSSEGHSIH